jgi:hypothetical protein
MQMLKYLTFSQHTKVFIETSSGKAAQNRNGTQFEKYNPSNKLLKDKK